MIVRNSRGSAYEVDEAVLTALVATFDLWRDGLGKFRGDLGRAAFLRATSDIVHRLVAPERHDAWKRERYIRALRTVLAERPRKSDGTVIVVAS